jgi:hypothetical protein
LFGGLERGCLLINECDLQKLDLKTSNDAKVKERYLVKISIRFVALDNLNDNVGMNRAGENITENVKISVRA